MFGGTHKVLTLCLLGTFVLNAAAEDLNNWALRPGYSLEVDSVGFYLPTSIAFVPDPGDAPDDPLYFVTQLQGEVKVVTNDRTVHTFAKVPTLEKQTPDLYGASQSGAAGVCLEPENGYVFVTFTYPDEGGVLHNNVARFTTQPGTFALEPSEVVEFTDFFADYQTAPAHQIGNCQTRDGALYVGVGDGGNAANAANMAVPLGKLLCFDFGGKPCRANPDAALTDYFWAYGFRNPFGIVFVGDELYVAENGVDVDRFYRARPGENHNWNGSDQSIAAGADLVFTPTVSPVQLDFIGTDVPFVDDGLENHFAFGAYGGEGDGTSTGVVSFDYSLATSEVEGMPYYLLEYVGAGEQRVTGFAVGPDALYAVPSVPDAEGQGFILKFRYDPAAAHGVTVAQRSSLVSASHLGLLNDYGCVGCHAIRGRGGGIGPALDKFALNWRLNERLNAAGYAEQIAAVDALTLDPYPAWRDARQAVLAATGRERTYEWFEHYLQNPKFDNPATQMPDLGLSAEEAAAVRDELYQVLDVDIPAQTNFATRLLGFAGRNPKALAVGAAGGAALMLPVVLLLGLMWRRSDKKETP